MKLRWITLIALFAQFVPLRCECQATDNMVFNPSFEENTRCPERIDSRGVMMGVDAWWQPTAGSSDYFNVCGGRECLIPRNKMGFQEAHSGNAYCGIYCSQEKYREYLQTQLKTPLVAGKRYRVSFYVSLAEKSPHAVATIGALLSTDRITDSTWDILTQKEVVDYGENGKQSIAVYYEPQIQNSRDSVLTDTKGWMNVSGEFIAAGGERYLTIGNFCSFNNSAVVETGAPNAVLQGAYYYIDDVSVIPVEADDIADNAATDTVEVDDVVAMWDVHFETGSSVVLPQSFVDLHSLEMLMKAHPSMRIELRGHTDSQGTVDFNQHLSEDRAQAVLEYLVAHGIDRHRMTAVGFGESMPVDTNDTPNGRRRNRRVEYRVLSR